MKYYMHCLCHLALYSSLILASIHAVMAETHLKLSEVDRRQI
jgi:hypothetical protein